MAEHFATYFAHRPDRCHVMVTRAPARKRIGGLADYTPGTVWQRDVIEGVTVGDIAQAVDRALAAYPSGGPHVFIDKIETESAASDLNRQLQAAAANPLQDVLKRCDARYILVVSLPLHQTLSVLPEYPGAVRLPWTAFWLEAFARTNGLDAETLRDDLGQALNAAELLLTRAELSHERTLYLELERVGAAAEDGAASATQWNAEIRRAIENASSPTVPTHGELTRIDEIMTDSYRSASLGLIGQTLLILFAFTDKLHHDEALRLVHFCLPDEDIPDELMSPVMRARYERQCEDAVRRYGDRPLRPSWSERLDDGAPGLLEALGLRRDAENILRARLGLVDVGIEVGKGRVALAALADRLLGRKALERAIQRFPLHESRQDVRPRLVELLCGLHRHRILSAEDLASVLVGLKADAHEPIVPVEVVAEERVRLGFADDDQHVMVGDVMRHVMAENEENPTAERRQPRELDDHFRTGAARHVQHLIAQAMHHLPAEHGVFTKLLEWLEQRMQFETAWRILGFFSLYGPQPEPVTFGRIVLAPFRDAGRDGFNAALRELRDLILEVMKAATSNKPDQPEVVGAWLDAVWSAVPEADAPRAARGLAIYLDDFITQSEILWEIRDLDDPRPKRPLLARLFLAELAPSPSPDLIRRLFARTPRDWLKSLAEVEKAGGQRPALQLAVHVQDRLDDVFHVIVQDIHVAEAKQRAFNLDSASLRDQFWRDIARALDLPAFNAGTVHKHVLEARDKLPGQTRHDLLALMDLYPIAVFLFWRFGMWSPAPLAKDSPEDRAYTACLERAVAGLAQERRQALHRASVALAFAAEQLNQRFERFGMTKTHAHHQQRVRRIQRLAQHFAPLPAPVPARAR
ncbi:hypothetical protein [Azorhizobium oxalatiphilum]|uniref:hypothetical protein n=1 Tax=Azorhizobium oxalatiphilum TaxID=980631 RepID=UPI001669465C|nr:hypothetical protein [Azorhizobium oxalatiphilum]